MKYAEDATGRTTYSFDASGNLAAQQALSGPTTYVWDAENQLVQALLPTGVRNTFLYNGDGHRHLPAAIPERAGGDVGW